MGKIIDRVRRQQYWAGLRNAGYEVRTYGPAPANEPPEMFKFRRWTPPAWASPIPDNLPTNTLVSVNAEGTGYVGTEPPKQQRPHVLSDCEVHRHQRQEPHKRRSVVP